MWDGWTMGGEGMAEWGGGEARKDSELGWKGTKRWREERGEERSLDGFWKRALRGSKWELRWAAAG